MKAEHRHDDLVKALDAISGVTAVPHCLLPMLAAQTLFVPAGCSDPEGGALWIYTAPGLNSLKEPAGEYADMTMAEILARMDREGKGSLVVDPGLPHQLPIRGEDLEVLRTQVETSGRRGGGSESVECATGSELALAAPEPLPPASFLDALKTALRSGGRFKRAWLFEALFPGQKNGELCIGVEPLPETDLAALERCLGDAAQKHAGQVADRGSLAFLPLQDAELIDIVASIGLLLDEGDRR
ncbi:MAG TPA: hypothetical protein PLU72_00380 [Candidatus Ozemobacteraceae bacterium]|nr:hypothetical protein [Candidatus Ozemobacteraceae bacterium]HQG29688.1 hypothetical protein [Candidatus Ozemobacteraceae bacterium]